MSSGSQAARAGGRLARVKPAGVRPLATRPGSPIIRLSGTPLMAVSPGSSSEATGEARFLANRQLIDSVIAFVCRRNHASAEEADDFSSAVWVKLIEDN